MSKSALVIFISVVALAPSIASQTPEKKRAGGRSIIRSTRRPRVLHVAVDVEPKAFQSAQHRDNSLGKKQLMRKVAVPPFPRFAHSPLDSDDGFESQEADHLGEYENEAEDRYSGALHSKLSRTAEQRERHSEKEKSWARDHEVLYGSRRQTAATYVAGSVQSKHGEDPNVDPKETNETSDKKSSESSGSPVPIWAVLLGVIVVASAIGIIIYRRKRNAQAQTEAETILPESLEEEAS